jgi:hypothetical protein
MPQVIPFDTHAAVKKLVAKGFTEAQAEAQTDLIKDLLEDRLVTKQYLDVKLAEVELKLAELELKIKAEIKISASENKAEILKWMVGFLLAQAGIIAALVKLL